MRWQVATGQPTQQGIPAVIVDLQGTQLSPPLHLRVAENMVKIHNGAIDKLAEAIRNPYAHAVTITPRTET